MFNKHTCFRYFILLFALTMISGCAPTVNVTSIKDKDYHQTPHRMLVVEDLGTARNNSEVTAAFNKRLDDILTQCSVILEKYTVTLQPTSILDKDKIHEDIVHIANDFKPDVILEMAELSHITITQNGIPRGQYPNAFSFTLRTLEGKKVWTSQVQPKGMFNDNEDQYKGIAVGAVAAMRRDGILTSCPESFTPEN